MALVPMMADEATNAASDKLTSGVLNVPTVESGFSIYDNRTYYYKKGSRVFLSVGITKDNAQAIGIQDLFTLPAGYRPYRTFTVGGGGYSTGETATINVNNDGSVTAYTSSRGVFASTSFDAFQ